MFDKKQRSIKRIHLVTADGLYDRKAFYKVEIVFIRPLGNKKLFLIGRHLIGKTFMQVFPNVISWDHCCS